MANDTDKLIIGGGELAVVFDLSAVPADDAAYDAGSVFGNIVNVASIHEESKVEHMGNYKGVKIRDDIFITSLKKGFKLTCDEFDEIAMRALFSANAGVDNTDPNYTDYIPLTGANTLKGYARLRIFDGRDNAAPRIEWKDFTCLISLTSPPTFDGENYSSFELEVTLLSVVGKVKVKKVPAP